MPFARAVVAAACLLGAAAGPAFATEPTPVAAYALPETETWDLASDDGQPYRILVSRPAGEAPDDGFPILYVLDGNAMFAAFAEARRIQGLGSSGLDKMIVVGIGYPGGQVYDPRRMSDFTAPIETPMLKALYASAGGRDRFETFLLEKLKPAVEKRYPVNPYRQTLYGHSLGGLFALHMLYTRPGAFRTIVAASPSIWWDNQAILAEERAWRTRVEQDAAPTRGTRLLLIAGEREEEGAIAEDTAALGRRLAALSGQGLRSDLLILDGETHLSVPHRSVTAALRAAARWP